MEKNTQSLGPYKVGDNGNVVIPMPFRKWMNLETGDQVNWIYDKENNCLILEKAVKDDDPRAA